MKTKAKTTILLITTLFFNSGIQKQILAQVSKKDSLEAVLKTLPNDTTKLKTLNRLAWELIKGGGAKESISILNEAYALGIARKHKRGLSAAAYYLGRANTDIGNYPKALRYYKEALTLKIELKEKAGEANVYNGTGAVYNNMGNYPEALKCFFKALKIKEETGDKKTLASTYVNIGGIYKLQGNLPEALSMYNLALTWAQKAGNKSHQAACYNELANLNDLKKNYSEALRLHEKSLAIQEGFGNKDGIAMSYVNMGGVYKNLKRNEDAVKYYKKSLEIFEELESPRGIAAAAINLGQMYVAESKLAEAKKLFDRALSVSLGSGNKNMISQAYNGLVFLDSVRGDYRSAFLHYRKCVAYWDSIVNEENTAKTVQEKMQYEFDKKENTARAEQIRKDLITEDDKKQQQTIRNFFIAGFLLVFIFSALLLRGYKAKQKANKQVLLQKEEVEKQKEMIEEKQKEILDSIHYAQKIQKALVTSEKYIEKTLERINKTQ